MSLYQAGQFVNGVKKLAIGTVSGTQDNYSIVLNANGSTGVDTLRTSSFYVSPMRTDLTNSSNIMGYSQTRKEVMDTGVPIIGGLTIKNSYAAPLALPLSYDCDLRTSTKKIVVFAKWNASASAVSGLLTIDTKINQFLTLYTPRVSITQVTFPYPLMYQIYADAGNSNLLTIQMYITAGLKTIGGNPVTQIGADDIYKIVVTFERDV